MANSRYGLNTMKIQSEYIRRRRERAWTMYVLWQQGLSLAEIGRQFGVGREAVRKIVKRHKLIADGKRTDYT